MRVMQRLGLLSMLVLCLTYARPAAADTASAPQFESPSNGSIMIHECAGLTYSGTTGEDAEHRLAYIDVYRDGNRLGPIFPGPPPTPHFTVLDNLVSTGVHDIYAVSTFETGESTQSETVKFVLVVYGPLN